MKDNTIFITGYAKLPGGITASELYKVIAVGVILDRDTGIIDDIDCSLVTDAAKEFVKNLIVGCRIHDIEKIVTSINDRYHGSAKKALISAMRIIHEKYLAMD